MSEHRNPESLHAKGEGAIVEYYSELREDAKKIGLEELGYYNPKDELVCDKGIRKIFVGENCLTENKIEIEIS